MTIPSTVMGISEPNSEFAPHFFNMLFSVAITNTILIWVMKLLIPNDINFPIVFPFNLKSFLSNFTDLNLFM